MVGNIKGALLASGVVVAIIVIIPMLIAMTYSEYHKYCRMSILLPCIGVTEGVLSGNHSN